MKKPLKQMIINEGKNRQIEIDEKPPNPVGIEEENRFAGGAGYYVFAFLFRVLVAAGRPRFRLVALVGSLRGQAVGGRTIVDRDHRGSSHWGSTHRGTSYRGSNHRQLSHRRCDVDGRRGCCFEIILMEGSDHSPQVSNCRCRLPGALLSFPLWLSPSLPFGPLPRQQSPDIEDQVTSPRRRLRISLPFFRASVWTSKPRHRRTR